MNNSKNNVLNTHFKLERKSTIILIITFLLLIIFISILIKVSLDMNYETKSNLNPVIILRKDQNADTIGVKKDKKITTAFNHNKGSNFSISTWIYIEDWDIGKDNYKIILEERNEENNELNMIIALDKKHNNLIFGIRINSYQELGNTKMQYFVYKNIHIQKWINIVYVVKNTMFDLYIDGDLKQRNNFSEHTYNNDLKTPNVLTPNVLTTSIGEIQLGKQITTPNYVRNMTYNLIENKKVKLLSYQRKELDNTQLHNTTLGFKGKISKLYYFSKDISSSKVKEIYGQGPY